MDPNANLAEQRRIVDRAYADESEPGDLARLAELVEALDSWIRTGGFLPRAWEKGRAGR